MRSSQFTQKDAHEFGGHRVRTGKPDAIRVSLGENNGARRMGGQKAKAAKWLAPHALGAVDPPSKKFYCLLVERKYEGNPQKVKA